MKSAAQSAITPVFGSRQSSKSTPENRSSSENVKPTPSKPNLSAANAAVGKSAHVLESVELAFWPVLGSFGIFVGFPSLNSVRQSTQWGKALSSSGIESTCILI